MKEDIGLNLLEEEMSIIKHIYNIKEEPVDVKLSGYYFAFILFIS